MTNTISIDAGGTFTDGYLTRGDRSRSVKVPTTPHDLTECFVDCIEKGATAFDLDVRTLLAETDVLRLATTFGTNAIIERSGPKLGVLVTEGNEETLYGEGSVDVPIVEREMIEGVDERVTPDGAVEAGIDQESVLESVRTLVGRGARIIVVSLRNAAVNDANERAVADAIEERYPEHYLRSVPVQRATQITDLPDDRRRTTAAVVNAYLHPELAKHLYKAEDRVRDRGYRNPLLAVHSDGGTSRIAKTKAINTYSSGPSAGLVGTADVSSLYGFDTVLTTDMGGTSVDAGLVSDGEYAFEMSPEVEGIEVAVPMLRMNSIGAGGGSIAWVEDGDLRIGPDSAGARPGPACYGLGGEEPTVTDADLVLGYLNPDYFLGGEQDLDADAARDALEAGVADPLGVDVETAARQIKETVDRKTGTRLASLVTEQGIETDAVDTLFSFGGAGPLHAVGFAETMGVDTVVTFPFGSVFNAFGAGTMDVVHRYTASVNERAAAVDPGADRYAELVAELEDQAVRDIRGEGLDPGRIESAIALVANHPDGERRLLAASSSLPAALDHAGDAYVEATRPSLDAADVVVEALQLRAIVPLPNPEHPVSELRGPDASHARKAERPVHWDTTPTTTPVYEYGALEPGNRVSGPAVVESVDTTYAIPAGWTFAVNAYRHGVLVADERDAATIPGFDPEPRATADSRGGDR
jgi:N-methylhydantoinase A/acetophenone carboxylase